MAFAAALSPIHCHPVRLFSGFSYRAAGADSPNAAPRAPKNPNKSWDDFYKRHSNKFFKDRHYLEKDWGRYFSVASEDGQSSTGPKVVLEVGCGAGNTIFPLRLAFPDVFVHACDFSHHAIALVKEHEAFSSDRVNAFVCDVTEDDICKAIMPASVDIVTMIFMLSAVSPVKMPLVLQNLKAVLKPSGHLLFRDYSLGDFAQIPLVFINHVFTNREDSNVSVDVSMHPHEVNYWKKKSQEKFADKNQKISENFYARGDGTCAYFFSEDSLSTLFEENGFSPLEVSVYCKQNVNRSRKVAMNRRWIRATFCRRNDLDSRPLMISDGTMDRILRCQRGRTDNIMPSY